MGDCYDSTTGEKLRNARLLGSLVVLFFSTMAAAEPGYINDQFEITLRSGESTRHSIIRMLESGTKLEVLSRNADTGYARVLLDDGTEGYVLTRFLSDQPVARDQLVWVRSQLNKLREDKKEVDDSLAEVRSENRTLEQQRVELEKRAERLSGDLAELRRTSASAISIAEENSRLKSRLASNDELVEALRAENVSLATRSRQTWFMVGAGAVILGALIGLILPRIRFRRRSKWGEL